MTERWVIHLPMVVNDLVSAQRLARVVAHWSHVLPQTEPGGTSVSPEDDQNVRHWVFCDRNLSEGDAACSGRITTATARRDSGHGESSLRRSGPGGTRGSRGRRRARRTCGTRATPAPAAGTAVPVPRR